jgi:hypothetical protein
VVEQLLCIVVVGVRPSSPAPLKEIR